MVYLHKAQCMREGKPQEWPPDVGGEPTLALLDRSYAGLTAEFAAREPAERTYTWYEPEQTVGFWIRRMAQETVIHRVDAEQAAGAPLAEIPEDLALDGIDEVLERFLSYGTVAWREDFAASLPSTELAPVLVRAGERGWLVRITPGGVRVEPAGPGVSAAATISGAPAPVLLWLWRRAAAGVTREGDQELIDKLYALLGDATQ
jgi:phage-related minor tail protein